MTKKKWKDLSQKRKQMISNKLYKYVFGFYWENNRMPDEEEQAKICRDAYNNVIKNLPIDMTYEEFEPHFIRKCSHYGERIPREIEEGMTWEKLNYKKPKKTPQEKLEIQKRKNAERRKRRKRKKELQKQERVSVSMDQDDTFFYIAGYTSGGAPYGVTWAEMGLQPWQDIDSDIE